MPSSSTAYSDTARWLHWIVAGAIVLQYVLAELGSLASEEGEPLRQLALLANHKSVGITILILAVVRLAWRAGHPAPDLPDEMPLWQRRASSATHGALYACLIALPISGWLMSSASAYSVSWFNLVNLPDLVGPNEDLKSQLIDLHELLAEMLFVIAMLHIAAAFKHALWDRDGVLSRMSSGTSLGAGALVLIVGGVWLVPGPSERASAVEPTTRDEAGALPAAPSQQSDTALAAWVIDYDASTIEFTGVQAGAEFTGRWTDWVADIHFDPAHLAHSRARVVIQTGAVSSNDAERDNTIVGPDFFDAAAFPTATFEAEAFTALDGGGFSTTGVLQIKSLRLPVDFEFVITETNDSIKLTGSARIDRLAYEVGIGDWRDTTWVGQYVDVAVTVFGSWDQGKTETRK